MNGDSLLSREELTFFLHPEESPMMKDVVAQVLYYIFILFKIPLVY